MNSHERVTAMLDGKPVDCLPNMPITMMLAADQIGVPYKDYVLDYTKLVDGQLAVCERFDFDHVGCVSDPAREAADCGAAIEYFPDQPPAVIEEHALLADEAKLLSLKAPDPLGGGRMHDRVKACALFRERVGGDKIIEGWVEGPCAEGSDLRGINALMLDFVMNPDFVRDLFAFVVDLEIAFAKAQLAAGADVIGVGDAAASLVGPQIYREFVLPYERQIIDAIKAEGGRVRMHICGNIKDLLEDIATLDWDFLDVDYPVSIERARAGVGPDRVLCGNLNPVSTVRDGTPDSVRDAIAECHQQAGERFVVGAGCEITRDTKPDNLMAMTHYARGR